jgi:MFS family permease
MSGGAAAPLAATVETDVFARLDRLPWCRFHVLVVAALGVSWILDGLEVTLAGSVSTALMQSPALHLTAVQVGLAGSVYVGGAVLGALFFGWLADRLGRRKLFFLTVALYLTATAATALSWSFLSFALFRFLTGAGIGGEYSAINSAIQELIPARLRGFSDLVINGSFWIGGAIGAVAAIVLLDPSVIEPETGWRLAFLIGAALGVVIFFMRFWLPESPRWLIIHGHADQANAIVGEIEAGLTARGIPLPAPQGAPARLTPRRFTPIRAVIHTLFVEHRRRAAVGLCLMAAQAFFYNAIFFTYALVLSQFYGISAAGIGWYILPFAIGNFMGPLLLGRLFDSWGRRPMIFVTYVLSALTLAVTGLLFRLDVLGAGAQTAFWSVTFFFASAAASAAYLTVSETFPLEIRALAIAAFYALGTGLGGIVGPWLFGHLIEEGSRASVFMGYALAAVLMAGAALVHARWGVAAERRPLEEVARPLSFHD